jgi:predicted flap endonuclease-1-like 5' DNA nuclease
MVKKKEVKPSNSHVREAYLAEGKERYTTPTPTVVSTTSIPNQPIAPIAVPNLKPVGHSSYAKNDLRIIEGIDEKTRSQLEKLGISNIDDLAKASEKNIAKDLEVDLSTARKWISAAKKLQ